MHGGRAPAIRLVADGGDWNTDGNRLRSGGGVRRPRAANEQLRALIGECGISHKGLARRVVALGAARGMRGLGYDHSSVARWLAGAQPRDPVPALIAEVLSGLLAGGSVPVMWG